jgi:hypothetical protein
MTSFMPPFHSSPQSEPNSTAPGEPYSSRSHQLDTHRRHPVAISILTVFTLLPVGLIVGLMVSSFLWVPWRIHAFQATTDGELLAHGVEDIVFEIIGFPLAVCILSCGHVAASFLWSGVRTTARLHGSARGPFKRLDAWAKEAGGARVTLFVVLLLCLAFAYSTIVVDGCHLVWRLISPETI